MVASPEIALPRMKQTRGPLERIRSSCDQIAILIQSRTHTRTTGNALPAMTQRVEIPETLVPADVLAVATEPLVGPLEMSLKVLGLQLLRMMSAPVAVMA